MTFWELAACVDGWNRAQGDGHAYQGEPITDEEYDRVTRLLERLDG